MFAELERRGPIDQRLRGIWKALNSGRALKAVQQQCRTLCLDCTAVPWKAEYGRQPFVSPRFLAHGWEEYGHCLFAFAPYVSWGEAGHYFEEVFERLVEFIVSPVPRADVASALKESLACYLSLRGYQLKPATAPLISVNIEKRTITVRGKPYDVSSEQALRWVKVLNDNHGEWITGEDLRIYDDELLDVRTDQLKKFLPKPVLKLIESRRGLGSRLKP